MAFPHAYPPCPPAVLPLGPAPRGIRMKLSMNRPHYFKGSVLVAQALPQYLCCGLSFACGLAYQTFCGSTGPLEKAAQDELDLTCGIGRGGLGLLLVQSLLPH